MGLIQMGGLGSGIDVTSIIDALVNAERTPKTYALDTQEALLGVELSGLGSLKSALNQIRANAFNLTLPSAFSQKSASVSTQDYISVVGSTSALPGKYDIEVVSLAQGSESTSNVFTGGGSTTFGNGSLIFTAGTESFEVDIDASDSLEDIQAKINSAGGNIGVTISILSNVTVGLDTGSIFKVTSSIAGTGNDIVVTTGAGSDASLDDLSINLNLDESASDAEIKVDGFTSTQTTNIFDSVIEGVTITAGVINDPGETTTLTIKKDTDSVKTKILALVDSINSFLTTAKTLGSADEDTPGLLLGNSTLRQSESQIRNSLTAVVSGITSDYKSLSALGITTARDGSLSISTSRLNEAIDEGFTNFEALFSNEDGVANKLINIIDGFASSSGIIQNRENSINSLYDRISEERDALDYRIENLQIRLTKQFSLMDSSVAQFNATSQFLTQQLANLPGFSNNNNKK